MDSSSKIPTTQNSALSGAPPELLQNPDYEIVRELGRGGMGVVFLAKNRLMERMEVLKVLGKQVTEIPEALERFRREIVAAARLRHRNIVTAYTTFRAGESLVLAMEYVDGLDLAELLRQKGPLPIANACHYARQAALGLQHAFEQGMAHRDIKPANLMLSRGGEIRILDFGLARLVQTEDSPLPLTIEPGARGLTRADAMMGTPDFIAPEQILDARSADIRADIYSLGCTLYCLLTGQAPFDAPTLTALIYCHLEHPPPDVRLKCPEAPPELAAIIARMLAKKPEERFQKPIEVAQALTPFVKPGSGVIPAVPVVESPSVRRQAETRDDTRREPTLLPVAARTQSSRAKSLAPEEAPARRKRRKRKPKNLPYLIAGGAALLLFVVILTASLVRSRSGTAVLLGVPQDATITLNGEALIVPRDDSGRIEVALVPRAPQTLKISRAGYQDSVHEMTVDPGSFTEVRVEMVLAEPSTKPRPEPVQQPPEPSFASLFNGKDLSGWQEVGTQGRWKVEQGVLVGRGGPDAPGYLATTRTNFTDFHLIVEMRINDGGNSDISFGWAPCEASAKRRKAGYGFQLDCTGKDPTKTGSLWGPWGALRTVTPSPVPAGQWFKAGIIVRNEHIILLVNNELTATYSDRSPLCRRGCIALSHGDAKAVVEIRSITILETPPDAADGPRFPIAAVAEPMAGQWFIERDILVQPNNRGVQHLLFGDSDWTDYDVTADVRQTRGNEPWNAFLLPQPVGVKSSIPVDRNTWHSTRVSVRGKRVQHFLDGIKVSDAVRPENQVHGLAGLRTVGAYRFRNIKVTDPNGKVLLEGLPDLREPEPIHEPLFNGKNLAGWVQANGQLGGWKVSNGNLTSTLSGILYHERQFADYRLHTKFFISSGMNSGVVLRAPKDGNSISTYQVELVGTRPDQLRSGLAGSTGLHHEVLPRIAPGDVQDMVIEARGNRFKMALNGIEQFEFTDTGKGHPRGHIGLERSTLSSPGDLIFKSIEIEELPPEGSKPLFNGRDLHGWKTIGRQDAWRVSRGVLVGDAGTTKTGRNWLYTRRSDFGDFHLWMQARLTSGGQGCVHFRCDPLNESAEPRDGYIACTETKDTGPQRTGAVFVAGKEIAPVTRSPAKPEEWFTLEIIARDSTVTTLVNGEKQAEYNDPLRKFTRGAIALHPAPGSAIEYRRIYIKESTVTDAQELLVNPSCEMELVNGQIPGWRMAVGSWQRRDAPTPPHDGKWYFSPVVDKLAVLVQDVDVSRFAETIDAGKQAFEMKAFVQVLANVKPDQCQLTVEYLPQDKQTVLSKYDSGAKASQKKWAPLSDKRPAPKGTRWIRVSMTALKSYGTHNDGYFDGLSLKAVAP